MYSHLSRTTFFSWKGRDILKLNEKLLFYLRGEGGNKNMSGLFNWGLVVQINILRSPSECHAHGLLIFSSILIAPAAKRDSSAHVPLILSSLQALVSQGSKGMIFVPPTQHTYSCPNGVSILDWRWFKISFIHANGLIISPISMRSIICLIKRPLRLSQDRSQGRGGREPG